MDWISGLNKALRYIEEHLTDEGLSVETLAQISAYSPFYLQRLFYGLTGMTLSEYIRNRRLSVAGQVLQTLHAKVIDVALSYGYETPESFQKAFRRFHGITPSAAQRTQVQLHYLNPLQIKVELTGGTIMDYTVENMEKLTVIGKVKRFGYEDTFDKIPLFWDEYYASGAAKQVCPCVGVSFCDQNEHSFPYMIGSFCEPDAPVPEGFEKRELEANTWVKFRVVGPLPGSIQKVNRQIFTQWLPNNTEYETANNNNIEVYTEGDTKADDYESEIWLPVKQKV